MHVSMSSKVWSQYLRRKLSTRKHAGAGWSGLQGGRGTHSFFFIPFWYAAAKLLSFWHARIAMENCVIGWRSLGKFSTLPMTCPPQIPCAPADRRRPQTALLGASPTPPPSYSSPYHSPYCTARRMRGQGGAGAHVCSIHAGSGARAFMSLMRPCTCTPPETSATRALVDISGVGAVETRWRRHARAAGAGPPAFLEVSRTGRRGWRGMRGAGGASSRGVRGEGDGPERPWGPRT